MLILLIVWHSIAGWKDEQKIKQKTCNNQNSQIDCFSKTFRVNDSHIKTTTTDIDHNQYHILTETDGYPKTWRNSMTADQGHKLGITSRVDHTHETHRTEPNLFRY